MGFAELSSYALSLNGAGGPIPTATLGSVQATVSAKTGPGSSNPAVRGLSAGSFWLAMLSGVLAMVIF